MTNNLILAAIIATLVAATFLGHRLVRRPPTAWSRLMATLTKRWWLVLPCACMLAGIAGWGAVTGDWATMWGALAFMVGAPVMHWGGRLLFTELNLRRRRRKLSLPGEAEAFAVLRACWGAPEDWRPVVYWVEQRYLDADGTFPAVVTRSAGRLAVTERVGGVTRSAGAITVALPAMALPGPFTGTPFVHEAYHALKMFRGEEFGDPGHTGKEWSYEPNPAPGDGEVGDGIAALLARGIR